MARQTSIEAYHKIKENGLLSMRKFQVYDYVFSYGPITAKEVWLAIAPSGHSGNITTRFSELRRLGVFYECGIRVDEATGMKNILWDVTAKIPVKQHKEKPVPRKKLLERIEKLGRVREAAIEMYRGIRADDWSIFLQQELLQALKESEE